jgi:hypothetical protein
MNSLPKSKKVGREFIWSPVEFICSPVESSGVHMELGGDRQDLEARVLGLFAVL